MFTNEDERHAVNVPGMPGVSQLLVYVTPEARLTAEAQEIMAWCGSPGATRGAISDRPPLLGTNQ